MVGFLKVLTISYREECVHKNRKLFFLEYWKFCAWADVQTEISLSMPGPVYLILESTDLSIIDQDFIESVCNIIRGHTTRGNMIVHCFPRTEVHRLNNACSSVQFLIALQKNIENIHLALLKGENQQLRLTFTYSDLSLQKIKAIGNWVTLDELGGREWEDRM